MTDDLDADWLASLARQSAASANTENTNRRKFSNSNRVSRSVGRAGKNNSDASRGQSDTAKTSTHQSSSTKAERIARREHKKLRYEERKRAFEEARQRRRATKRPKATTASEPPTGHRKPPAEEARRRNGTTAVSGRTLHHLSAYFDSVQQKYSALGQRAPRPESIQNGLPVEPRGKATKRSALRVGAAEIQPRRRDYNGQGLARPTLYLPLSDPSFVPKLELEFSEHVDFGSGKRGKRKNVILTRT